MEEAMKVEELDGAASGLSDVLGNTLDEIALCAARKVAPYLMGSIREVTQTKARIQVAVKEALAEQESRIDLLHSWEADAQSRANILEQHLRYVLEIARTWTPEYAQPVDLATLRMAEMLVTPNAKLKGASDEA